MSKGKKPSDIYCNVHKRKTLQHYKGKRMCRQEVTARIYIQGRY